MTINYVIQLYLSTNYLTVENPIYIHCTGRRGRSVSVAIASLMDIKGYTLGEAIKYVKRCRPQMMLSQDQIAVIKLWAQNGNTQVNNAQFTE